MDRVHDYESCDIGSIPIGGKICIGNAAKVYFLAAFFYLSAGPSSGH